MEKSVTITYEIVNPGKRGLEVEKAITEELKRIYDAIGPISGVVVKCSQHGKRTAALPMFEKLMDLQRPLQIGEIKIKRNYSQSESPTPKKILDELRRLHDEFGDLISEIEDDPEWASSALESTYVEMEKQLDALEDALDDE